jgi:nucleotide-binding universal stress UspA family protein
MELQMRYSTLLVHLKLGVSNEGLLKITGDLAERFEANVIGVTVCKESSQVYLTMLPQYTIQGDDEDLVTIDRQSTERMISEAEQQFRTALASRSRSLHWRSTITSNSRSQYVARQARAADILITSPVFDGPFVDQRQELSVGDIVMYAGRPVLLVPPNVQSMNLDTIMIGWKDTRESRRAIADALPLLALAKKVVVVEIASARDLPDAKRHVTEVIGWLQGHEIAAESYIEAFKKTEWNQLEGIARETGAGLFVAGAYGHTRLREWMIGGVTEDLLLHPRRPTLISH